MSPVAQPRKLPTKILAALTRRDRSLFLDKAMPNFEQSAHIDYLDESDLAPGNWEKALADRKPEILITGWNTPPLPESWISSENCALTYVCHITGSVRQLVPRSFIERGGIVTNWGERISAQVAEHGLLLALAALRNQASWEKFIGRPIDGRHISDLQTRSLFGLRVGLHGFGSVARALLPLLAPFGVTITAYSAGVPEEVFAQHRVTTANTLIELFEQSDVLFECESLTPATAGSVSAQVLAALPTHSVFVNIGRGGLVNDEALAMEGHARRLRLALDVVSAEPLTPSSILAQVPNIVLSPHIGGPTFDRYFECGIYALSNVERALKGETPVGAISLAMFDRAT